MSFLSTLEQATKSLKAVEEQLASIREHARRMGGASDVIPFDHNNEHLRNRYRCYDEAVYDLGVTMRSLKPYLPGDAEYKNILGWALAFDEISRGLAAEQLLSKFTPPPDTAI